jgi:hypothetical protein
VVKHEPSHDAVFVRAIAWRANGATPVDLPDVQNLERLLDRIVGAAYPGDVSLIRRWLSEVVLARGGKLPRWKAAIHLWCALRDEKASEHSAADRFLGQHDMCKLHVEQALRETGLMAELEWLFGRRFIARPA